MLYLFLPLLTQHADDAISAASAEAGQHGAEEAEMHIASLLVRQMTATIPHRQMLEEYRRTRH
jgi:hypothetical protein